MSTYQGLSATQLTVSAQAVSIAVGQWQHIVMTIAPGATNSSAVITLYLNGKLVQQSAAAYYQPFSVSRPMAYMGHPSHTSNAYFNGAIDAIYFYNYALSSESVSLHYAMPKAPVIEFTFATNVSALSATASGTQNSSALNATASSTNCTNSNSTNSTSSTNSTALTNCTTSTNSTSTASSVTSGAFKWLSVDMADSAAIRAARQGLLVLGQRPPRTSTLLHRAADSRCTRPGPPIGGVRSAMGCRPQLSRAGV